MPISSGRGGWPTKHYRIGPPKQDRSKVVVVDRGPSPAKEPPPPSPTPSRGSYHPRQPRPTSQPPPYTAYPGSGYNRYPPYQQQPPPQSGCCGGGCCGGPGGGGPGGPGGPGNGCCGYNSMYTTGIAGAGAGCCAGGMFGSKSYPFDPNNQYNMKGTGKRRCWACVLAAIFGLLLLALLLGLLLGLKPYLEQKEREKEVKNALSGGYYRNGAYFYPITDPPDRIFLVMGPGIPCNADNNNSVLVESESVEVTTEVGVTDWAAAGTEEYTVTVPTDRPNCNEISSTIVRNDSYTNTPGPTVVAIITTTDGATRLDCVSSLTMILLLSVLLWL